MQTKFKNLNQALLQAMDNHTDETCFRLQRGQGYRNISYHQFQKMVFHFAHWLKENDISQSERVVIACRNSLEWMVCYMGTLMIGAVAVPIRSIPSFDLLKYFLDHTAASVVILDSLEDLLNLSADEAQNNTSDILWPDLPHLKHTLLLQNSDDLPEQALSLKQILYGTRNLVQAEEEDLRLYAENVSPQALAAICYVSSETSWPKGAVFDHSQHLTMVQNIAYWLKLEEDDLALTLSPWGEIPSLTTSLHYFVSGIPNVALDHDYEDVLEIIRQTGPSVMVVPPYALERFYETWMRWLSEQPESNQKMFHWALDKGLEYRDAGSNASQELQREYVRADLTFFSQIRGRIGGRLRALYSTGASLATELADFYEAIGLPVLNLYSLTEAGGFPSVSFPEARKQKSCGQLSPHFEVRLSEEDEILVRGKTVMRRYWKDPERTEKAFDEEGWLYSGDLGHLDEDGYLFITGRKEHLLVMSTGRKVAPSNIEAALVENEFIAHATVFGDGKSYLSALIVPDVEALKQHFEHPPAEANADSNWIHSGEEATLPGSAIKMSQVKRLIDTTIEQINHRLDRSERIERYTLLEQAIDQSTNEFAETLKVGREVLMERFAAQIETLYPHMPQVVSQKDNSNKVQVNPERLRELLEKENILDAWMNDAGVEFMFDLAREKRIEIPSMVNICDAVASIAQMEHEEIPLSTAMIVGEPRRIARVLPQSQVHLLYPDHIRRMRKVLGSLTPIVDGLVLAYVVDKYGYVRGIHKLEVDLEVQTSFLLGPQFRRHAAISQKCDAVVFYVPAGGRQVRVFANGQLLGRFSNGDWSPENMLQVDQVVAQLAKQEAYNLDVLQRILKCSFTMSEQNLGAIFVIGDTDLILKYSDVSEISAFAAITSTELDELSDQELINFARQDGATVIDPQGRFHGCMVLLRPNAETKAEVGPGKGARHSSAAKMSAEADCIAITVSQDGPITVYHNGKRLLSM